MNYMDKVDMLGKSRHERVEREDTFLNAFGSKNGSDRRKQRRARKGWDND